MNIPGAPVSSDKWLHGFGYGLLAFLFWRFFATRYAALSSHFVLIAAGVLLSYAAADEYMQQFVNRGTDFRDWCADTTGVLIVLTLLELLRRRRKKPASA